MRYWVLIHSGLTNTLLNYCESIDKSTIVPAQVPLLIEFLCICNIGDQLNAITPSSSSSVNPNYHKNENGKSRSNTSSSTTAIIELQPFQESLQPPPSCLRTDLDAVYILSRCLYYHTLPPAQYIQVALLAIGKPWTRENYDQTIQCYLRFTRKLDIQLIASLSQQSISDDKPMCEYPLKEFALREDDRARYYALSSFTAREVRLRLALIQFFNQCLLRVVHLVDLVPSGTKQDVNTLGKYISGLTGYIFPFVKENFLELLISQTIYRGKDAYPIVELDNRRVYTDMERSMEMGDDGETRSALTSQCFFAQLFRQMQKVPVDVLRAPLDSRERLLSVKYKGEQGLDWGGLYRDAIERWYVKEIVLFNNVLRYISNGIDD